MSASPAVGVIGAGSMGEALIVGLIERAGIAPAHILASAPRAARRDELATAYGIAVTDDNRAVARAGTVILAVKPQVFPQVARDVRGALVPDALLISTIAGLPIARLCADCGHDAVVRAMPNTPARIGAGMFECLLGRAEIADAVIEHGHQRPRRIGHSRPLVDGTPPPSMRTASRSARATPLNVASIR